MEELIIQKEHIKAHLNQAIEESDKAMKVWKEKTKVVSKLQNELMKINSKITNFNR
jgi:hypothetical protein